MERPRWGILGAGNICNDFAAGVVTAGGSISAVGASSLSKAQALADKVKASRAVGSYEELVADPDVDVVYVGTIHTMHLPHARMALNAGKHVVCEKPLAVNEKEAQELVDLARAKGLFLMEAMWTRFFPVTRKVQEILASGELGAPKSVQADFGFIGPMEDKNHRLWDLNCAGGAMLDIGIYLVQLATMVFGASMPSVQSTALLTPEGVDHEGALSLCWSDKGSASLLFTLRATTPEHAVIMCEKGYIRLHGPAHTPERMTVFKSSGVRGKFEEQDFDFPLPQLRPGLTVIYPSSEGMMYQVLAAEKCLKEQKLECPEYPLEESLTVMRIMDAYRRQVGVTYPSESTCTVS
ncbi:2-dihydrobenzene-1 [Durusdinium trenchii]